MMKKYLLLSMTALFFAGTLWAQDKYIYPYTASDRDPMQPLINERGEIVIKVETSGVTDIVLQGIMFSEIESTVIINNEIYRQGDTIGNKKLIKIEPNGVIIESEGKEYFLNWGGQ